MKVLCKKCGSSIEFDVDVGESAKVLGASGGRVSRRGISVEAQAKMQAGRGVSKRKDATGDCLVSKEELDGIRAEVMRMEVGK